MKRIWRSALACIAFLAFALHGVRVWGHGVDARIAAIGIANDHAWIAMPGVGTVVEFVPGGCTYKLQGPGFYAPSDPVLATGDGAYYLARQGPVVHFVRDGAFRDFRLDKEVSSPIALLGVDDGVVVVPLSGSYAMRITKGKAGDKIPFSLSAVLVEGAAADEAGLHVLTPTNLITVDLHTRAIASVPYSGPFGKHLVSAGGALWFVQPTGHKLVRYFKQRFSYFDVNATAAGELVAWRDGVAVVTTNGLEMFSASGERIAVVPLTAAPEVTALGATDHEIWAGTQRGEIFVFREGQIKVQTIDVIPYVSASVFTCGSSVVPPAWLTSGRPATSP